MNTKLIMSLSAITMGIAGILFIFLPQEIANIIGWEKSSAIVFQILGAIYFGFAMINWMSKSNLIGGIYNRPLAIGNFTHCFVAAMALFKYSPKNPALITVTIFYIFFAVAFGYILFTHPIKETKAE